MSWGQLTHTQHRLQETTIGKTKPNKQFGCLKDEKRAHKLLLLWDHQVKIHLHKPIIQTPVRIIENEINFSSDCVVDNGQPFFHFIPKNNNSPILIEIN